jgi:sulfur-oxidizing protein SoxY
MQRRTLLGAALSAAQLSVLIGAGLVPRTLLGAWPQQAFEAESTSDAERLLFGERGIEPSDQIAITAPDIAENGRVVPVEVTSGLPDTTAITILSETNPTPLLARARLTPRVAPRIAIRVKLGGTGNLVAIVEADGRLHRARRTVKVTAGGCGS